MTKNNIYQVVIVFSVLFCMPFVVLAEESSETKSQKYRITVLADPESAESYPGSGELLDGEEFQEALGGADDISRVLRTIPGVNIQEEDGFGLRPNIGFRGVDSERSAKITLMEDGVLIAPAPYAAPSAYFFPPVGRMEGIEVLKGASQIKYGPNTNGGSLNMLSSELPDDFKAFSRIEFGENNARVAHVKIGDSFKYGAGLVETYQAQSDGFKELDGGGNTGFDVEDYMAKFRVNTDPNAEVYQELQFKVNAYDQRSEETYLGLTDADFELNPFRRYAGSQLDQINVDHNLYQIQHYIELPSGFDVTTTFYHHETERNWYKLQSVNGVGIASILRDPSDYSSELDWIRGGNSPTDALVLRNNAREYEATGVQTVVGKTFETGQVSHELEVGLRYHSDEEDRFQDEDAYQMIGGTMVLTNDGAPGTNANRIGEADAFAAYVQDSMKYKSLTVTPGLRYEHIDLTRKDYGKADPSRSGVDLERRDANVSVLIPGVGAHYAVNDALGTFVGVHKGFAPPGPGASSEVEEEESLNYELGVNFASGDFQSELVFFWNDYENLLGADTLSSGGEGTGDLFNAGDATTYGLESTARYMLLSEEQDSVSVPVYATYTYTQAEFDSDFDSDLFGLVQDGDALPYVPENQFSAGIGVQKGDFGLYLDAYFVDAMPTFAGSVGSVSSDLTDSYFVTDVQVEYQLNDNLKWIASVDNVFDEEYVVARRPAGARPGAPRLFYSGIVVEFG